MSNDWDGVLFRHSTDARISLGWKLIEEDNCPALIFACAVCSFADRNRYSKRLARRIISGRIRAHARGGSTPRSVVFVFPDEATRDHAIRRMIGVFDEMTRSNLHWIHANVRSRVELHSWIIVALGRQAWAESPTPSGS